MNGINNLKNENDIDFLKKYLNSIDDYSIDNESLFIELSKAKNKNDKKKIISKIINNNLKLVYSIAKKFKVGKNIDMLDIIQEGNIGLYRAISRYDFKLGYKFSIYALWWIKKAIYDFLSKNTHFLSIPSHIFIDIKKIEKFSIKYIERHGVEPNVEILSKKLNITKIKVQNILNVYLNYFKVDSIFDEGENKENIESTKSKGSLIIENNTPHSLFLEKEEKSNINYLIKNKLNKIESNILKLRYGIGYDRRYSFIEIRKILGYSLEKIRKIEKKSLNKLKKILEKN